MNEKPEVAIAVMDEDAFAASHDHDLMKLFDELSFKDKWMRVSAGLKKPKVSGEHKWAKLQLLRLLSPAMAVVVPILFLVLITLLAQMTPEPITGWSTKRMPPPEPMKELDPIVDPIVEPPVPPDPTTVEMNILANGPSDLNENVTAPADTASVKPTELNAVANIISPVSMPFPPGVGDRSPGGQKKALDDNSSPHTAPSVLLALRWLAKTQSSDGTWGKNKTAMTSLALLAYMAHGDTPASDEFGRTVEAALRYLVEAQTADGHFKGADPHDYTQPIAAYALCEAAGMTRVPQIRAAAVKAVQVIVKGQNGVGSFDYNLNAASTRSDLSYAGWCVQAMKAAHIAKLDNDVEGLPEAMKKAVAGIKWHYAEKNGYGGFDYSKPGIGGLTGVGILCLQFLDEGKSREVRSSLPTLANYPFSWGNENDKVAGKGDIYYWYYNTQACFQEGGGIWKAWNKEFSSGLVKVQTVIDKELSGYVDHKGEAHDIGFWENGPMHHDGGNTPVMGTILCTLMLEVYYRYRPMCLQAPTEEINKAVEETGDELDIKISDRVGMAPRS